MTGRRALFAAGIVLITFAVAALFFHHHESASQYLGPSRGAAFTTPRYDFTCASLWNYWTNDVPAEQVFVRTSTFAHFGPVACADPSQPVLTILVIGPAAIGASCLLTALVLSRRQKRSSHAATT